MSEEPRYVLDDDPENVTYPLITKSGKALTEADVDALAEEAEHGYDVFRCPRCGRRSYHPRDLAEGYCGHCHDWTSQ